MLEGLDADELWLADDKAVSRDQRKRLPHRLL